MLLPSAVLSTVEYRRIGRLSVDLRGVGVVGGDDHERVGRSTSAARRRWPDRSHRSPICPQALPA